MTTIPNSCTSGKLNQIADQLREHIFGASVALGLVVALMMTGLIFALSCGIATGLTKVQSILETHKL